MAIHEQVLTQQSLLDFFAQMKDEDRKKQEKEEIIAEYKYKMELEKQERIKKEQKLMEEQQKRKLEHQKYNYIIQLIKEGYSVENAEQESNRKFVKMLG